MCLQDAVHIRPRRRGRKEDRELQLAGGCLGSTLWPSCLPPGQRRNLGRSQMRGPRLFSEDAQGNLFFNLKTSPPNHQEGHKVKSGLLAPTPPPSSPSLSTENNFLLGVRWVKKDLITVSVSDLRSTTPGAAMLPCLTVVSVKGHGPGPPPPAKTSPSESPEVEGRLCPRPSSLVPTATPEQSLLTPERLALGYLLQTPKAGSVQFRRSVVPDSLRPHESQHARPPCPSPTPGVYPNPCASSR